jgi:hypothetical protein
MHILRSSLRNVIERTIGVWKKRWHISCDMRPFPLIKQQKIIIATTTLHNFIRVCGIENEKFNKFDNISGYVTDTKTPFGLLEYKRMKRNIIEYKYCFIVWI